MSRLKNMLMGMGVTAALMLGLGANAQAIPITGDISFGGAISLAGAPDLATTTRVDFINPALVTSSSGDLAGLGIGSSATFTDFQFNPFLGPVIPLWTAGGFQFDLTSMTNVAQLANDLDLSGSGILSGPGFDPTPFNWSFSADRIAQGSIIAFSATNAPSAVPEPASVLLLGLGLVGLSLWGRKAFQA